MLQNKKIENSLQSPLKRQPNWLQKSWINLIVRLCKRKCSRNSRGLRVNRHQLILIKVVPSREVTQSFMIIKEIKNKVRKIYLLILKNKTGVMIIIRLMGAAINMINIENGMAKERKRRKLRSNLIISYLRLSRA